MKKKGNKQEVWEGLAEKTSGGLKKEDLKLNAKGNIVSIKKSEIGQNAYKHLQKKHQPIEEEEEEEEEKESKKIETLEDLKKTIEIKPIIAEPIIDPIKEPSIEPSIEPKLKKIRAPRKIKENKNKKIEELHKKQFEQQEKLNILLNQKKENLNEEEFNPLAE